jgi:hypothetical protein
LEAFLRRFPPATSPSPIPPFFLLLALPPISWRHDLFNLCFGVRVRPRHAFIQGARRAMERARRRAE